MKSLRVEPQVAIEMMEAAGVTEELTWEGAMRLIITKPNKEQRSLAFSNFCQFTLKLGVFQNFVLNPDHYYGV